MRGKDLAKGNLVTRRQGMFGAQDFKSLSQLEGAKIIAAGFPERYDGEGGFAIDFQHEGKSVQRLVLGYTELGEWIAFLGDKENG